MVVAASEFRFRDKGSFGSLPQQMWLLALWALKLAVETINLLMTEAIWIPCTVLAVEASFPGVFRRGPRWAKKVMRISFAALRFIVATGIESFVAMSALVAALFCHTAAKLKGFRDYVGLGIFPIVAFHYCKVKKVGPCRKVLHGLVLVYGLFIMIFGTIAAVQSLTPSADGAPGEKLRPGLSAECLATHEGSRAESSGKGKPGFFKGLMQDKAAHKIFPVFWLVCVSLAVFQYIMDIRVVGYEVAPITAFLFELLVPLSLGFFTFVALGDPGTVPARPQGNSAVEELMKVIDSPAGDIEPPDINRLCTTTWVMKGLRTKYCVQTGACVEEFDHYCVWLNNTIGKANHRQFVGLAIVEFFTQVTHVRLCMVTVMSLIPYQSFTQWMWGAITSYPLLAMIVVIHCVTAPWVLMLTLHQSRLVLMNLTTNEMMNMHRYEHFWTIRQIGPGHSSRIFRNPFNKGSGVANCLDFWWHRTRWQMVAQPQPLEGGCQKQCCNHSH
eukprot:s3255_g4.t1